MRTPRIMAGMAVGLAAAVALEAERPQPTREHERKQRDRRHSPEGNRKQRRAAQAIYRRSTKHD